MQFSVTLQSGGSYIQKFSLRLENGAMLARNYKLWVSFYHIYNDLHPFLYLNMNSQLCSGCRPIQSYIIISDFVDVLWMRIYNTCLS